VRIILRAIAALVLALLPFAQLIKPESAQASYNFAFPITVQDTSNVSRTNVPVILSFGGTQLINAGYTVNGLDTNMQNGVVSIPYMMDTTNVTTVISSLPAGGSIPLNLLTGYSPAQTSFPIIVGNGGNVTTANDIAFTPVGSASMNWVGYLNTSDIEECILIRESVGFWYPKIFVSSIGVVTANRTFAPTWNLSVSGVPSGTTNITLSWDGVNTTLNVNGTTNTTATADPFPWGLDWKWMYKIPYTTSIKYTVDGVELIHYQPSTMVVGTALPNLDSGGLYPGTINFGTNSNINVIYGQQTSTQQIAVTGNVTPGFQVPAFPMPNSWFASGEGLQKYQNGLATVISGNSTVLGLGTNWTSVLEGRSFQMNGTASSFNITAVNSTTNLTLSVPYSLASVGPAPYSIDPANPPPYYSLFYDIAAQAGIPVQTLYFIIVMPLAFLGALLCIVYTKSALLGVLVLTIVMFLASAATIVPMWIPFSILVLDFGIMYLYRQITY